MKVEIQKQEPPLNATKLPEPPKDTPVPAAKGLFAMPPPPKAVAQAASEVPAPKPDTVPEPATKASPGAKSPAPAKNSNKRAPNTPPEPTKRYRTGQQRLGRVVGFGTLKCSHKLM